MRLLIFGLLGFVLVITTVKAPTQNSPPGFGPDDFDDMGRHHFGSVDQDLVRPAVWGVEWDSQEVLVSLILVETATRYRQATTARSCTKCS